ncbi:MAG: hypothetical protein FWD73_08690 [Polyangiaceae bacterium]|nr:hypothetical protein [Polyangiaceae bacterium]
METIPVWLYLIILFSIGGAYYYIVYVYGARPDPATAVPPVPKAPRYAGPDVEALFQSVLRMDLNPLGARLAATRQAQAWDDRGLDLENIGGAFDVLDRGVVDVWARNYPNDAGVRLVSGVHAIHWAWKARGTGAGSTVTKDGARLMRERLRVAQSELLQAIAMDPADPTPHAHLITCAKGLQLSKEEAFSQFSYAMAKDPENIHACKRLLDFLHPKWFGSIAEVRSVALDIARRSRPGSDLRALPFLAHAFAWEYTALFDDHRKKADAAIRAADARAELDEAWANWAASQSPSPRRSTIILHNYAAFCLYLMKDQSRLALQLRAIGTGYINYPWCFLGKMRDPVSSSNEGFAAARKLANV